MPFPGAGPSFIVLIFVSFFFRLARRYTSSVQSDDRTKECATGERAGKKGWFSWLLAIRSSFFVFNIVNIDDANHQ